MERLESNDAQWCRVLVLKELEGCNAEEMVLYLCAILEARGNESESSKRNPNQKND